MNLRVPLKEQHKILLNTYNWLRRLYHSENKKLMKSYGFGDTRSLEAYILFIKVRGQNLEKQIKQGE